MTAGWYVEWLSSSGRKYNSWNPRTLPEAITLGRAMNHSPNTRKPFVYYSTTGPR